MDDPVLPAGAGEGHVVGVARIGEAELLRQRSQARVELVIEEVAQTRAGRRALRERAVVRAESREQSRGAGVPADLAEIIFHPRGGGRAEEILDVELDDDVLPDVGQRIADDRVTAFEAGCGGMRFELFEQAAEDRALDFLQRIGGRRDRARAPRALGHLKLTVRDFDGAQLHHGDAETAGKLVYPEPAFGNDCTATGKQLFQKAQHD